MRTVSIILIGIIAFSCKDTDISCLKGKFLDGYCEGVAIQILDDSKVGVDWSHPLWSSLKYENVVIASIDSVLNIDINELSDLLGQDSVLYFSFREGGYPQIQYNLCYPAPFITITEISNDPLCD